MERSFKGIWIPKHIWLDKNLSWIEKFLLVEIDSLDNEQGCWANNRYFADFFGISKDRVSKLISGLNQKGYITVDLTYKQGSKAVEKRIVKINEGYRRKQLEGIGESNYTPIGENNEDNNTSFNNTLNNTNNKNNMSSKLDDIPYSEIINYLNDKTGRGFRCIETNKTLIRSRWREGYRLADFKKVIDIKCAEWSIPGKKINGTPATNYLRPATLFGTKFDSYLQQDGIKTSKRVDNTGVEF